MKLKLKYEDGLCRVFCGNSSCMFHIFSGMLYLRPPQAVSHAKQPASPERPDSKNSTTRVCCLLLQRREPTSLCLSLLRRVIWLIVNVAKKSSARNTSWPAGKKNQIGMFYIRLLEINWIPDVCYTVLIFRLRVWPGNQILKELLP